MQSTLFWQAHQAAATNACYSDMLVRRLGHLGLILTYPGWQDDILQAERAVLTNPQDLEDTHFFKMEEKQRMHDGDRSHPRLAKLDAHVFTYPGWQVDAQQVEQGHVLHRSGCYFDDALQLMIKRENVYKGDRSHPDLVHLDRLKRALSYPGWEHDFLMAEKSHLTRSNLHEHYVFKLIEKQRMHNGDRSHVRLRKLDSYSFDYPGFELDKKIAEDEHVIHKKSPWFDQILQTMQNRQSLYDGIHRSHSSAGVAVPLSSNNAARPKESSEGETPSNPKPCVICMSEPKTHAFIPCGHHCACEICAFEAFGRTGMCPICRREADSVAQIFFS